MTIAIHAGTRTALRTLLQHLLLLLQVQFVDFLILLFGQLQFFL